MTPSPSQPPSPSPSPSPIRSRGRAGNVRELPAGTPPSPSLSPSPSAADSSASSRAGSSGSAAFIADAGPAFDPKQAPAAPVIDEPELPLEEWSEEQIEEFFMLGGETLHMFLRVGADDRETFIPTERDVKAIVPPATRIANRYDAIRAAAAAGDEILLATALSRYAIRNYARRRRLLAAQAEQAPAPITGAAAPPETGPEHDPEWQRVHADPLLTAPPDITPKGAHRR